ncbi:hypothetical protein [Mesorhizobium sp.]|uniref:hypothetical protein n=1 Tax=Mesorhizobium sp. TaxID=1871066 RepID=UPI0034478C52
MAYDARDEAGGRAVVDAALDFGRGKIDVLVNNARMTGRGDFSCVTLDGWDEILTVNDWHDSRVGGLSRSRRPRAAI